MNKGVDKTKLLPVSTWVEKEVKELIREVRNKYNFYSDSDVLKVAVIEFCRRRLKLRSSKK